MKGEFRGPVLRLLYETLRGFVKEKERAFNFERDMPKVLVDARDAWDFSQPAPPDPSSAAGSRGAAPSAAPPVAAPSATGSSSAAAMQGAPPPGQQGPPQGNSPMDAESCTLVDALRELYEPCDGEFTTRASMYAKVASRKPAAWRALGTEDQRAQASRPWDATPSSHDPFTHIVASEKAPRSAPQAVSRSKKKTARRFPMLLSGR